MTQLCLPSHMRDLHYVTWTRAYANTKGQQTAGSGVCALVQVRCSAQASTSIRLKSLPVQNPFLLFVSSVVRSNRQPGTRKTHLGSCLLLLTQRANNMLTYSHEVLPVLCSSSCADVICPVLTLAMTQTRVPVDIVYMHVNARKLKLNTFQFQNALSTSY